MLTHLRENPSSKNWSFKLENSVCQVGKIDSPYIGDYDHIGGSDTIGNGVYFPTNCFPSCNYILIFHFQIESFIISNC